MSSVKFLYVDLFCGAGGTTTGVEQACDKHGNKIAKVIACVNHDAQAINSHYANHKHVKHFTEDIRNLRLGLLMLRVKAARRLYPDAKLVLWASLECTNFSNAKGGKAKDADSRTLANHLFRYIEALQPEYIQIENVREFMAWGDLDENGKPLSRDKGRLWYEWLTRICDDYKYTEQHRLMNAADYGAYTSRNRLFMCFAKEGLPICFPEVTHSKKGESGLFGTLKKWKAVREVLDLDDKGICIFDRKKPLVENSLRRIYVGLEKFVSKDENVFISKYYSGNPKNKNHSVDRPVGTVTTIDHNSLVNFEKSEPFLVEYYGNSNVRTLEKPLGGITTNPKFALASTEFVTEYYGNGSAKSLEKPMGTITTKDRVALIQATTNNFMLNPQWGGQVSSIDRPCFTLIARMDKAPPYLVCTEKGELAIKIADNDSPFTKKIKRFMATHGIIRVSMRMLRVDELLKIQGFPNDYILLGNKTERKKFIGNAVHPLVAQRWVEVMALNQNKAA